MVTIGILGGMSAASTALYYARLNQRAQDVMGGLHSAELLVRSLDFAKVEVLQAEGDWEAAGALLNREALALEAGGAGLLILATNTMHKVADRMTRDLRIPFLHIGDATAAAIIESGLKRPGLIATAYTMEQAFYTDRLRAAGLDPIIPGPEDRATVHRIIYDELCRGVVREESRGLFEGVARGLADAGADSLILGCTEVGMLLEAGNVPVPVFDTVQIHCDRAFDLSRQLAEEAPTVG
ncbi:aspartate/glutamate racemase family protein [Halovulum dunhuangense]|uniref:Aspartate/glutamate racemase family protein n=1 Tax=Halovulum dunhuangense TaxID=1505036 RepID=A0A849KU58_9RHOB|nr:aspartate/glutamate racemase family protein [Halovulum dunhuangense]NNU79111.1 aspartate/glutamate racemase family protein [Halovulum dunhuangense]